MSIRGTRTAYVGLSHSKLMRGHVNNGQHGASWLRITNGFLLGETISCCAFGLIVDLMVIIIPEVFSICCFPTQRLRGARVTTQEKKRTLRMKEKKKEEEEERDIDTVKQRGEEARLRQQNKDPASRSCLQTSFFTQKTRRRFPPQESNSLPYFHQTGLA